PGLPASLGATIDRCLAQRASDRFPDAESLASALAPVVQARPSLSPSLRAWLQANNPLLLPYLAWSGGFGALTTANLIAWVTGNRPNGPADIVVLAAITAAPLLPVMGFHLEQARRQFRAGFTLADLRGALETERRERAETEAISLHGEPPTAHRALRVATILASTWLAVTVGLLINGTIHERTMGPVVIMAPVFSTLLLGAVSNALGVAFIPRRVRAWWQSGMRERLWKSRVGSWFAKRLGAPERSVNAGAFRATESALGVAAAELFAALPAAYREELAELPATLEALEARAAEARAALDVLAALEATASRSASQDDVLQSRRVAATRHLKESVAALESVRLDLLRLHAGANDLAPLTTLIDAARLLGDDVRRLADAQHEVETFTSSTSPSATKPRE
ncbi:MAG TPA: hypothetical protein VGE27_03955, partial [Gemmatimonas sp.]